MKRQPQNKRGWTERRRKVSYLPSPPPRFFTRAIFRAVFDSRSSFFAPKPHGNDCYAGYQRLVLGAPIKLAIMGHFRVPKPLTFKTRLSALSCDNEFVYMRVKDHFHINNFFSLSLASQGHWSFLLSPALLQKH